MQKLTNQLAMPLLTPTIWTADLEKTIYFTQQSFQLKYIYLQQKPQNASENGKSPLI